MPIKKTNPDVVGGSGGGGNPPLKPDTDPEDQTLGSGSTTTSVTFSAANGGSGSSTPSVSIQGTPGSGASLSGSGLGPYTISGLTDGEVINVICEHTDDDTGDAQVVQNSALVCVSNPPAGVTEVLEFDGINYDFTTSGPGTHTVNGYTIDYYENGTVTQCEFINGVLTVASNNGSYPILIIDIGEDVYEDEYTCHVLMDITTEDTSVSNYFLSVQTNDTNASANKQYQTLAGFSGSLTNLRARYANSSTAFVNSSPDRTITNITTTTTLITTRWDVGRMDCSYEQGVTSIPTDGDIPDNNSAEILVDLNGDQTKENYRFIRFLPTAQVGEYQIKVFRGVVLR